MQGEKLFADGGSVALVGTATAADVNTEALDFLVECGERNHEALSGFCLVPSGALEHVDNDAAFDFVHDLEKRRVWMVGTGARARLAGQRREKFGKLQADTADNF